MSAGTLELTATQENAHSDYIRSVGFSPDGKTIASGSANPFVAAIELVRMTRRTHRAADARATAESVMSTAFDACPSPNAVAALLHEVRMPHP